MIELTGHFDGKVIVPDVPPALAPGQRLVVHGGGSYGGDQTEYRTEVESFSKERLAAANETLDKTQARLTEKSLQPSSE